MKHWVKAQALMQRIDNCFTTSIVQREQSHQLTEELSKAVGKDLAERYRAAVREKHSAFMAIIERVDSDE